jgi:cold shock CspA family protein
MASDSTVAENILLDGKRLCGMVKWFNYKSGFGFITVSTDEENFVGKDIFVHYSSIRSENLKYKYLVQGEYVEFSLIKPSNGKHDFQAVDITGILAGPIMCETQQANGVGRYRNTGDNDEGYSPVAKKKRPRRPAGGVEEEA